jgi:hypothetical protein
MPRAISSPTARPDLDATSQITTVAYDELKWLRRVADSANGRRQRSGA